MRRKVRTGVTLRQQIESCVLRHAASSVASLLGRCSAPPQIVRSAFVGTEREKSTGFEGSGCVVYSVFANVMTCNGPASLHSALNCVYGRNACHRQCEPGLRSTEKRKTQTYASPRGETLHSHRRTQGKVNALTFSLFPIQVHNKFLRKSCHRHLWLTMRFLWTFLCVSGCPLEKLFVHPVCAPPRPPKRKKNSLPTSTDAFSATGPQIFSAHKTLMQAGFHVGDARVKKL